MAERAVDVECTPYCADVEAQRGRALQAGQADCRPLFEAHLECWEQNTSRICDKTFTGCAEQAQAWSNCVADYCKSEAAAKDPQCARGRSTLLPF